MSKENRYIAFFVTFSLLNFWMFAIHPSMTPYSNTLNDRIDQSGILSNKTPTPRSFIIASGGDPTPRPTLTNTEKRIQCKQTCSDTATIALVGALALFTIFAICPPFALSFLGITGASIAIAIAACWAECNSHYSG